VKAFPGSSDALSAGGRLFQVVGLVGALTAKLRYPVGLPQCARAEQVEFDWLQRASSVDQPHVDYACPRKDEKLLVIIGVTCR